MKIQYSQNYKHYSSPYLWAKLPWFTEGNLKFKVLIDLKANTNFFKSI